MAESSTEFDVEVSGVVAHILYRIYGDDEQLLYIGVTANPGIRVTEHSETKSWWQSVRSITLQNFPSRAELMWAERVAIKTEDPLHNVMHSLRNRPLQQIPSAAPLAPFSLEDNWDWLVWQWWLFVSDPTADCSRLASDDEQNGEWQQWLDAAIHLRWMQIVGATCAEEVEVEP